MQKTPFTPFYSDKFTKIVLVQTEYDNIVLAFQITRKYIPKMKTSLLYFFNFLQCFVYMYVDNTSSKIQHDKSVLYLPNRVILSILLHCIANDRSESSKMVIRSLSETQNTVLTQIVQQ